MEHINENISQNLKRIRAQRLISLDEVAEQTGISKSMLGQIERGSANPTINILTKLCNGLRVPIDSLVKAPSLDRYHVFKNDLTPSKKSDTYELFSYFPYEKHRNFKFIHLTIEPNGCYKTQSHGHNSVEYIFVSQGVLTIEVDGVFENIDELDGYRFFSDRAHAYYNNTDSELNCIIVFFWE